MATIINSNNGQSSNGYSNNGQSSNGYSNYEPSHNGHSINGNGQAHYFPTHNNGVQEEEDKPFDIDRVISLARRYWLLLVIFPVLSFVLAVLYLKYAVGQYKTTATIIIKKDDKQKAGKSGADLDISTLFSGTASNTADEVEILKSQVLMEEVLTDLKINPTIYSKGRIKDVPYFNDSPIIVDTFSLSEIIKENNALISFQVELKDNNSFEAVKGKEKVIGQFGTPFHIDNCFFILKKVKESSRTSFIIKVGSIEELSKKYLKKLEITPIKGDVSGSNSNAISIAFVDEVPKRGVEIVSKLIEVYNKYGVEDKNSGDINALKFIDSRIHLLTGEVSSGDKDIENYKKSHGIISEPETAVGYALGKLGASDSKITELEIKKSVLNALLDAINEQKAKNDFSLMPFNLVENNSSIALQIAEYNKLISERLRLLKFAQEKHASVVLLENQIISTRNLIQESIEATLKNLRQEITVSLAKFKTENTTVNQELKTTPTKERELLEITRLKNLKESIYLFLLQKREETALSLATTVVNAHTLERASRSLLPISPNREQTLLVALLIGFIIPIVIINLIILLNNTIENEDEIRTLTSTPFLGHVTAGEDDKKQIVVEKGSRTGTAETFRLLRSNLQFMLAGSANKTILVTSSMTGEGKSFTTLNLGVSLALTHKKTIILGFDLRKPKLTSYLQNTNDKADKEGLTNYLAGELPLERIVHSTDVNPYLYYISSGPVPPNPAELIMQERTDKLFEYLREEFDYILIDTPPVGMVVDAVLLAKYAATTLYVTRFGVTRKKQLRIIDLLYKEHKLPNPSIVLNAVKYGSGYGYSYGYGYGYGYVYGEDKVKKTLAQRAKRLLSGKKK